MRTFTTYEVSATKCNFAGKKRQLRIGTLTTCGQLCSQLCTNVERPFIKLTIANPTYALLPEKSLNFSVHFDILR